MNVKFTNTTSAKLSQLSIQNGQIIALTDKIGFYYDMEGVRRSVSGVTQLTALPESGQSDMLYVVYTDGKARLYSWNPSTSEFVKVSGGAETMELTWAEYQALSNEEQMNGTEYFITDGNGTTVVDDTQVSYNKAYSSAKVSGEFDALQTQLSSLTLLPITRAAYDALTTKDANTLYIIKE